LGHSLEGNETMAGNKNIAAKRTAAALSAGFGGTRQQLVQREIGRDEASISLYRRDGYFDRQVSLNDVYKMLADLKMPIANEGTLVGAMKDTAGLKLKNGEVLKLHTSNAQFAAK
jgi:hypothetical protein